MEENFLNKISDIFNQVIKGDTEDYAEKIDNEMNQLNFTELKLIKEKNLSELTESDFEIIGLEKIKHSDFENIYQYRDLNHIKKYITVTDNCFELREFMLEKTKDIFSTEQLLDELLIKWRLKM